MAARTTKTNALTNSRPVRYLDTTSAYDLWSTVYDTDGNFLQGLDTIEMKTLLPLFLSQVQPSSPWKIVDLGCGTGRNTAALLNVPDSEIVGLDASPKMLEVARTRLQDTMKRLETTPKLSLEVYDLLGQQVPPSQALDVDAVISTLVLEHVPIKSFFNAASSMLKANGLLLITNMHSEMGSMSQAGFVDPATGEKIRPKSYVHRVDDVLTEATSHSFELVGDVLERAVTENLAQQLGQRAEKWIEFFVKAQGRDQEIRNRFVEYRRA